MPCSLALLASPCFNCPYCSKQVSSKVVSSLHGALRVHVQMIHPDDFFEAASRLQAALSSVRLRSLFDLEPMETIPGDKESVDAGEEDDDEDEDEEDETSGWSAADAPPPALPGPLAAAPPKKKKAKRHSYTLKQKFKALQALGKAEAFIKASLSEGAVFFAISALELVCQKTGIPVTTLKTWVVNKEKIRDQYKKNKLARKRRHLGGGRTASFPAAEAALALLVRDRRQRCKIVSKAFVLKNLRLEAQKENAALYEKTKFSPEMVAGFMRRNRFSLRFPSCIRSDDLPNAILICRAFHRQLLGVLADDGTINPIVFFQSDRFHGEGVFFQLPFVFRIQDEANTQVARVSGGSQTFGLFGPLIAS